MTLAQRWEEIYSQNPEFSIIMPICLSYNALSDVDHCMYHCVIRSYSFPSSSLHCWAFNNSTGAHAKAVIQSFY